MWQKIERRLLPELDRFPSRDAADSAMETAKKRRPMLWVILLYLLAAVAFAAAWAYVKHDLLNRGIFRDFIIQPVSMILFHVSAAYIGIRLWVTPIRRSLRTSLQAKGIPICIPCGYDLRGQLEPRCPECGAPFDARLVSQLVIDDQPS